MCTVTFLPVGKNGFILTSNRDEKQWRGKALPPGKFTLNNHAVFYPKDTEAGGTWIATGGASFTLCLLNGGFTRHHHAPPYRRSRGLVLLDFFWYQDVPRFAGEYDFSRIEPFTLLIVDTRAALVLDELVWDGEKVTLTRKRETEPHIWSSVTLYDADVAQERRRWFVDWLAMHKGYRMDEIVRFHRFGGKGDKANDLLMNRNNELLTVSITSIQKSDEGTQMQYHDLAGEKNYSIRII